MDHIPRMRTAPKIIAEIKALDPNTEITEYYIRSLVKNGTIPVVWVGHKALINLDDVLDIMRQGTGSPTRIQLQLWAVSDTLTLKKQNKNHLWCYQHRRQKRSIQ